MRFLNKLITAGSGTSSMRAIAIFVILNIMIVWTWVCIKDLEIADIPWGVLGMAGLVLTGKVVQRFAEGEDQESETDSDNSKKEDH
jgi:hypothetical protein